MNDSGTVHSESCDDCSTSAKQSWAAFWHGCPGCRARMVSRSAELWHAKHRMPRGNLSVEQVRQDYREYLAQMSVTHEQVRAAAAADFEGRAAC